MEKFPMRKDWIECGGVENLFVGTGGREGEDKPLGERCMEPSTRTTFFRATTSPSFSQIRACPEYFMTSLLNFPTARRQITPLLQCMRFGKSCLG